MKNIFSTLVVIAFLSSFSNAIAKIDSLPNEQKVMHTVTDSFAVSGNCTMCKSAIEKAVASATGILKAEWNVESKFVTVHYNPHSISLDQIKQLIAKAGYDTDTIKATDESYNGLPRCCQYDRDE